MQINKQFQNCYVEKLSPLAIDRIPEELLHCSPSEDAVQQKLEELLSANPEMKTVADITIGDVVRCNLVGSTPKYQQENIAIVAGSYLFDKKVEDALICKTVGSMFTISADHGDATIQILSVQRPAHSALDDAFVQRITGDEKMTLARYRQELAEEMANDILRRNRDTAASILINRLAEDSVYFIDEAEWNRVIDDAMETERQKFRENSAPDKWEKNWEMNSPNIRQFLPKKYRRRMIQEAIFEQTPHSKNIVSYEEYIQNRSRQENRPVEVLRRFYSLAWYEQTQLSRIAQDYVLKDVFFTK